MSGNELNSVKKVKLRILPLGLLAGLCILLLTGLVTALVRPVQKKTDAPYLGSTFVSNDHLFKFEKIPAHGDAAKTAGFITAQGKTRIFKQDDLLTLFADFSMPALQNGMLPTAEKNGGIKKVFEFEQDLIALISIKSPAEDCFSASLINLSRKLEIFQAPCLPIPKEVDFNGIGGGYARLEDSLLLAIGTPTTDHEITSKLAQNTTSPYGKVLEFDIGRIRNGDRPVTDFTIFTSGHRNTQGMVNIDDVVYSVEQGPKGGDKINILARGENYGWPIASFGARYRDNIQYSTDFSGAAYQQPVFSFMPSVATSDVKACPEIVARKFATYDCILVASLRGKSLFIIIIDRKNKAVRSIEQIFVGARIREIHIVGERVLISTDFYGVYDVFIDNAPRKSN